MFNLKRQFRTACFDDATVRHDVNHVWFDVIQQAFEPLLEQLDHHYLNEVSGLENPTSEHLAHWIWERLKPVLAELKEVEISETCDSGCRYRGA